MKIAGLIFLLTASQALADERILQEPQVSIECREARNNTGICVRGPTYYNLVDGRVRWVDPDDTSNPKFWDNQTKKFGGSDLTGAASQGGGGTK